MNEVAERKTRMLENLLSEKQQEVYDLLEFNDEVEEVFFGGSAGPGKTTLLCLWQILRRCNYPGTVGFLARRKYESLLDTTMATFWRMWALYFSPNPKGITAHFNAQRKKVLFSNGSEIKLLYLRHEPSDPDYQDRFGSTEFTDGGIDEVTECPEKAVNILNSRIRYKLVNGVPKMLSVGNPANNWVKYRYVSNQLHEAVKLEPYQRTILAKLSDNPDPEFREAYKKQLEKLPLYDRMRLLEGAWDVIENNSPFFYEWDRGKHLADSIIKAVNTEPIWLSFDFNVEPTTVVYGQKIDFIGCFVLGCIQTEPRKGGTERLCDTLVERGFLEHPGGLLVTGDNSGHSRATSQKVVAYGDFNTDFNIIKEKLNLTSYELINTRTANTSYVLSRGVCNSVLKNCNFKMNREGCEVLATDLDIAEMDENMKLKKNRETFKMDACDAFRYLVNAWFRGANPQKKIVEFAESLS